MKRRSFFLSLLVVLAACATPSGNFMQQEVKPDNGLVIFYRKASAKGKAIRFSIMSNQTGSIGTLSSGTNLQVDVQPGSQTFTTSAPSLDGSDMITLDIKAGEIYYVNGRILWGWPAGRPKFARMPDAEARAELARM